MRIETSDGGATVLPGTKNVKKKTPRSQPAAWQFPMEAERTALRLQAEMLVVSGDAFDGGRRVEEILYRRVAAPLQFHLELRAYTNERLRWRAVRPVATTEVRDWLRARGLQCSTAWLLVNGKEAA